MRGKDEAVTSCDCPQAEVTVVLRIPVACVHRRQKGARAKRSEFLVTGGAAEVCDDCRSRMRAQDDGWQVDLEANPGCTCSPASF